jgi:hypothetical protein
MKLYFEEKHSERQLTSGQAVEKCSLSTEEILGKIIEHLAKKELLNDAEAAEILYWDVSVYEDLR